VFKISEILPIMQPIRIIDVGAMFLGEGHDPYDALARATQTEIIGFEPVEAELKTLRAKNLPNRTYLPYVIGDGSRRIFHECNYPMTSSLFPPDSELMGKFQSLEELVRVVKTTEVETRRLDDIPEVAGADYLKLDTQGAELLILQGAQRLLQDVMVVHTEVEFVSIYKGQPLFAEVDQFLRQQGFVFHRFAGMQGRTFKPLIADGNLSAALSQTLWSDAIYVKDFMRLAELPTAKLLKLAVILHENYKSLDLVSVVLEAIDKKEGTILQPTYLKRFSAAPS